jgi:5-methylcytosine-specific restriction endonuclease McrA
MLYNITMPYKDPERQREYQRLRSAKTRADWLAGRSCKVCGSIKRLEVDHIDPDKKVSHRVWSWSNQRREIELSKCQVLCHTHHVEKTNRDNGESVIVHGTNWGYIGYKCRCRPCTDAHVKINNEWRWQTGRRKKRGE